MKQFKTYKVTMYLLVVTFHSLMRFPKYYKNRQSEKKIETSLKAGCIACNSASMLSNLIACTISQYAKTLEKSAKKLKLMSFFTNNRIGGHRLFYSSLT